MESLRKIVNRRTLCWVLLFAGALGVRLLGLRHGEENRMVYHPDVAKQTMVAVNTYRGTPHIREIFRNDYKKTLYPYGAAVLLGRTIQACELLQAENNRPDQVHRFHWALWMRRLSTVLILISTAILLTVLNRQLGFAAAFLAGLLLLFEPIQVQLGHYAMNDIPLLAFLFLVLAAAMQMPKDRRIPVYALLAGLAAGIATAIKYQGLLALVFPGMFWLYLAPGRGMGRSLGSMLAVAAGFLCGLLLFSPLLVRDPGYFFTTFPAFMDWQAHIMGEAIPLGTKLRTNLHALCRFSLLNGNLLLWAGGLWGGIAALRRWKEMRFAAPVFGLLLFCGLLTGGMLFSRDMIRENDLIPVFAFLILAAAFPAAEWLGSAAPRRHRAAAWAAALLLAAIFITVSLQDSLALQRPDTRIRAREWCDAHLPEGAVVIHEMYTLCPTREDLQSYPARYLTDPLPQQVIRSNNVEYVITSDLASARYRNPGSPFFDPDTAARYDHLFDHSRLCATFRDRRLIYAQPTVSVYEWTGDSP